ncbi:MAG: hypothetical protein KDK34_11495 [Leptospiraceae bacterium]|nr:hypothetical protein [Leptospiraceae bacterium]
MRRQSRQKYAVHLLLWMVVFFFAIDILVFRNLLWQIPDESAWDDDPFYHFETHARHLKNNRDANEYRVLVVGSSIALYSVLTDRLESTLRRQFPDRNVRVRRLSHLGLTPLHLRAYMRRVLDTQPDLVIWPTNPVDQRLERPLMQESMGQLYAPELHVPALRDYLAADSMPEIRMSAELRARSDLEAADREAHFQNALEQRQAALDRYAQFLISGDEYRMLAPYGWMRAYHTHMDLNQLSSALLAMAFASYRYRLIAPVPVRLYLDNRFSRGRSYQNYAGVSVGGDNVTRRGWTGERFSLPFSERLHRAGLFVQVPAELMQAAQSKWGRGPGLLICRRRVQNPAAIESRLTERWPSDDCQESTRMVLHNGWQLIDLPTLFPESATHSTESLDALYFELDTTFFSEPEATRLGVRLTRNAGRDAPATYDEHRFLRMEDNLYRAYSEEQYRASFDSRILRFEREGMQYLQAIRMAKEQWALQAFDPQLPAYPAMLHVRADLGRADVPLLLINSPENPISLEWYGDSEWYNDYVLFLYNMASASNTRAPVFRIANPDGTSGEQELAPARFVDTRELLRMQFFYDYHHLSYYGAEIFTDQIGPHVARLIRQSSDNQSGKSVDSAL